MRRAAVVRMCVLAVLAALAFGCTTTQGLKSPTGAVPTDGESRFYAHPRETVFKAVLRVLPGLELSLVEADPDMRFILAQRGMTAFSNGENVGVYIEAEGDGMRVTVVSRRRVMTNITAKNFETPVHEALANALRTASRQDAPAGRGR
jgi:hypothetical protein